MSLGLVKIDELKLGDVVRLFDGAFGDGIVKKIEDTPLSVNIKKVTIERVYMTTAHASYSFGAIVYHGHEDCVFYTDEKSTVLALLQRNPLK